MIVRGDCRELMPRFGPFDMVLADPPYEDTDLAWDEWCEGWEAVALACLRPSGSMWVFGSLRSLIRFGIPRGFRLAQDIVWEKHNGTGFAKDRFRRVHEQAVQFYRADAPWGGVFNDVQRVPRTGPDKSGALRRQPPHTGRIADSRYLDDGSRIARSVQRFPSVRGGPHKTAKPVELLELLIRTSCPPGGIVGDFFAGSGAGFEAARRTGRQYVGADLEPVGLFA